MVAVVVVFHKNMVTISYASRRNLGRGSVSSGQSGSRSVQVRKWEEVQK